MRALYYPEYGRLEMREVDEPRPSAGEVVVDVAACGICGSELGGFAARSPRRVPPLIMGHEFAGTVAALGEGVTNVAVGDRVIVNSVVHCGACDLCHRGATHLCRRREVFGMNRPGAFAERVAVPAYILFPMPPTVTGVQGALVEPLANGVHVLSLVRDNPLETVLICGAGTIGLMCLHAARAAGARRIAVTDTNRGRLAIAQQLGAEAAIDASGDQVVEFALEWTGDQGADLAIDAVGTPDARRDTIRAVRPGGDVVWIGLHDDEARIHTFDVVLAERRISGSYGAADSDIRAAIRLFAEGRVPTESWVEALPLEQGDAVFLQMLRQERDSIKAVLVPD
jgi:L-iditol 2-dehydrogenase